MEKPAHHHHVEPHFHAHTGGRSGMCRDTHYHDSWAYATRLRDAPGLYATCPRGFWTPKSIRDAHVEQRRPLGPRGRTDRPLASFTHGTHPAPLRRSFSCHEPQVSVPKTGGPSFHSMNSSYPFERRLAPQGDAGMFENSTYSHNKDFYAATNFTYGSFWYNADTHPRQRSWSQFNRSFYMDPQG